MFKDPDKVILMFPLLGGGKIEFGYAAQGGGMTVGTTPLMARITVSEGWGHYPDIWFIPDWLRADCYEYAYYELKNKP